MRENTATHEPRHGAVFAPKTNLSGSPVWRTNRKSGRWSSAANLHQLMATLSAATRRAEFPVANSNFEIRLRTCRSVARSGTAMQERNCPLASAPVWHPASQRWATRPTYPNVSIT